MAQPGRFPAKLSPMFAPGPKVEEVSAAGRAHHTLPGRTLAALAEPSGCNTSPMPAPTPDYEGEHPLCNAVSASATLMSTQRSPLRPRNRAGDETPTSPLLPGAAAAPVRTSMDFEAAEALAWLANGKQTAAQAGPDGAVGVEQRQPDPASTPAWEGAGPGGALGRVDGQGMPGVPHRRLSYEDDARKRMGSMAEPSMGEDGGDARCPKTYSLSSRVGQAALSILEYVTIHEVSYRSAGMRGVPERVLRQEFGNNPDTSKALRCLVTEGELQREGRGGRKDPFSYTHAVLNAYFSAAVARQRAQQAAAAEAHHAAWMHPSALPPSFLHAGGVAMPTVPHHGAQRPPADGQAAHKALPRVNPYLAAQLNPFFEEPTLRARHPRRNSLYQSCDCCLSRNPSVN
ncbi:hypothetical protein APUTEX25_005699, partial [Auxenochlorella protothecoides]